jgi:predicted DNA-binding transcriptional regulator YafY
MPQDRRRIVLNRLMQLAVVLSQAKRGLTIRQLMQRLESSKSTMYRDIKSLKECCVDVRSVTVNGEVRYSLEKWPFAAVAPTPLQLAALRLARDAMNPFEGTAVVEQLDQLLAQWNRLPKKQLALKYPSRGTKSAKLVGAIDHAIIDQKRLSISYQGERDKQFRQRKVEPIELRASGEQLYLFAYDVERHDYRTFKTARMTNALMLAEPAGDHSRIDVDERFARAIKTWTASKPTKVVVRLTPEKARFAREYPLMPDQVVTPLPDGSVEITAEVNGLTEALSWVLAWGAYAEAVSPPELRALAAEQAQRAAAKYAPAVHKDLRVRKVRDGQGSRAAHERENDASKRAVSRELARRGVRVAG